MENNKPISEWTLKEVQEMCDNRSNCTECTFYDSGNCEVCRVPVEWPLGKAEALTAISATDTDAARKPRLAEMLGVEVGEKFKVLRNGLEYDCVVGQDGAPKGTAWEVIYAINHPESIIRAPRLTEAELAICKAVGVKWVSKNKYGARRVTLWDEKPIFDEGMFSIPEDDEHSVTIGVIGRISDVLFPSVKPGDCIEVEADDNA